MEQTLTLLTFSIPSFDLPGPNVKIPEKLLRRRILDKNMGPIYSELKYTLACSLPHHDIMLTRNKDKFQWTQNDVLAYIKEAI